MGRTTRAADPEQRRPIVPAGHEAGRPTTWLSLARAAFVALGDQPEIDAWVVTRLTEDHCTALVVEPGRHARARAADWVDTVLAGLPTHNAIAATDALGHHLLGARGLTVVPDLRGHLNPQVVAVARRWGLTGYVGHPLRDRTGRLIGALEGWSTRPLGAGRTDLAALVGVHATGLQNALGAEVLATHRRLGESYALALGSRDDMTRLPDRRGWAFLLGETERWAEPVAEPVGIIALDLGMVNTTRKLRAAVEIARDAVDGGLVARIGGRQLGVLVAGRSEVELAAISHHATRALHGRRVRATGGCALRRGIQPLRTTWRVAEDRLLDARRRAAYQTGG